MLRVLIKVNLQGYLANFTGRRVGGGKKRGGVLFILLYLYVAGAFIFLMGSYFNAIAAPFYAAGLGWLYFTFYGILSFGMMFVLTVFMTQSQFYDATDNELLLAMPIPPGKILGSRVIALVLENFIYGLIVAIPALYVWQKTAPLTAMGLVAFVLITLMLPFFSFALSGIFGFMLHFVLSRVRNKTLFGTLFSLAFLTVYFVACTRINTYMQTLITQSAQIAGAVAGIQPLYWLGAAVSEGNTVFLVGVLAIIGAVFLLVYAFLSATFLTTATTKRGVAKVKYKRRSLRLSSPKKALLRKELTRLFSSTVYLLNACLGVLLLLVGSVVLVVKRDMISELLDKLPGLEQYSGAVLVAVICFLLLMCMISAPSVSLEGKSIWIPKSMPVMPITVLMAKVKLHMVMTIPVSVIASTAGVLTVKLTPLMLALVYLLPVAFTSFLAFLGVVVNVRFPRLDWQSEAQVVKQGVSVAVCLFGGTLLVALAVALYAVVLRDILPVELYMLCITVIFAAMSLILYAYLLGGGTRRFEELS